MHSIFTITAKSFPVVCLVTIGALSYTGVEQSSTDAALSTTELLIDSLDELAESTRQCQESVTVAVRETQYDLGTEPRRFAVRRDEHFVPASAQESSEARKESQQQPRNTQPDNHNPVAIKTTSTSTRKEPQRLRDPSRTQSTPVAIESTSNTAPRLAGIARHWEERWNVVEQQANLIEDRFQSVAIASTNYWNKVECITAGIHDEQLRKREKEKNKIARTAWDEVHQRAAKQISRIQQLRAKGQDFLRVMQLAAMREDLGRHAEELKAISDDADSILAELQSLSESGKALIQAETQTQD